MASGSGNNNNFNLAMGEHMFDKVLTPSDVGKLNRLVIPKQHAENYFPLEDNQNGTLLDFQDRNGKMWRFRYLYWSSSQSYVMTKGWVRFVKDKNLAHGDTISFHRGYVFDENEPDKRIKKLFVDWRYRADRNLVHNINHHHHYPFFMSPTYPTAGYYPLSEYSMPDHYQRVPPFYHDQLQERDFLGYGYGGPYYGGSPLDHHHHYQYGRSEPLVYNSYPVYPTTRVSSSSAMLPPFPPFHQPPQEGTSAKKLRLFGVDVEESSSSGEALGEMGVAGYSSSSPVVIRDEESSSAMQLSHDEEYKRKGKSIDF